MPIFQYTCPQCEVSIRRILKPSEAKGQKCLTCGSVLDRAPGHTAIQNKEVVDTGRSCRKVERLVEIEDMMQERSKNDSKPRCRT
jgi:putative FmdB family regulatory protein